MPPTLGPPSWKPLWVKARRRGRRPSPHHHPPRHLAFWFTSCEIYLVGQSTLKSLPSIKILLKAAEQVQQTCSRNKSDLDWSVMMILVCLARSVTFKCPSMPSQPSKLLTNICDKRSL